MGRCETRASLWHHNPKSFKTVSKKYIVTKQQQKVLKLEPCIFLQDRNKKLRHNWAIKSTLGQKVTKTVYYIQPVIKRSNSINMFFWRLAIHFWDNLFKITILRPIPNPSLWCHSKIGSEETEICTSSKKRSKLIVNETLKWVKWLWGQFWNFQNIIFCYDVINAKFGHYVLTVKERSKSVTIPSLSGAIHFSGQF